MVGSSAGSLKRIQAGCASLALLVLAGPVWAASEKVVYSFKGGPSDGAAPYAGLIDVGGAFYGTTSGGGAHRGGTVFKVTPKGVETVVYSFKGGKDGAVTYGGLINVLGTLYGTTTKGGASNQGTVFKVTPEGVETVLYSFQGGPSDGAAPEGTLINVGGTLYGTTTSGGANGDGTVFSLTKAGAEKVVYSFQGGSDGVSPSAGLIDGGGTLYGTTAGIYTNSTDIPGTVFAVTTVGAETVLHNFHGGPYDGNNPNSGLIDVGGTLYGTTFNGGYGGSGTVFSISPAGAEKVVYYFKGKFPDGEFPYSSLIDVGGLLYGTTEKGGTGASGTVFSVTTKGDEEVVYNFNNASDGRRPVAGLINVLGTLYGTTAGGGASQHGTVFAVKP